MLRKHQPDHVLLRAARADAAHGLLDIRRLGEMLSRIRGRIVHKALDHVSPLAVPVMLEIGRETVYGEAADALLAEAADELVKEAMSEGDVLTECWPPAIDGTRRRRRHWPFARRQRFAADPAGVLYWPEQGLLAVADLHLEKGSSFAARGVLLPPYDTAATLARLAR